MVKAIVLKATGDETGAKVKCGDGYKPLVKILFKIQPFNDDK